MNKIGNYINGKWVNGDGEGQLLYNAVTGAPIASASSKGLDFASILDYARKKGNPALRKMTFHERGNMLKALALHLRKHLLPVLNLQRIDILLNIQIYIMPFL